MVRTSFLFGALLALATSAAALDLEVVGAVDVALGRLHPHRRTLATSSRGERDLDIDLGVVVADGPWNPSPVAAGLGHKRSASLRRRASGALEPFYAIITDLRVRIDAIVAKVNLSVLDITEGNVNSKALDLTTYLQEIVVALDVSITTINTSRTKPAPSGGVSTGGCTIDELIDLLLELIVDIETVLLYIENTLFPQFPLLEGILGGILDVINVKISLNIDVLNLVDVSVKTSLVAGLQGVNLGALVSVLL